METIKQFYKELAMLSFDYRSRYPEDANDLTTLKIQIGLSAVYHILKNANGRRIEVLKDYRGNVFTWNYV